MVEQQMRQSDFLKWIIKELSMKKKEEVQEALLLEDDAKKGKYVKSIKMSIPYIDYWTRDPAIPDNARGMTFVPHVSGKKECKVEIIEGDYMDCLDIWMRRNSIKTDDGVQPVQPKIKFIYADVPQGVHRENDKDAKGKLRKEDDHEEDPTKVCF